MAQLFFLGGDGFRLVSQMDKSQRFGVKIRILLLHLSLGFTKEHHKVIARQSFTGLAKADLCVNRAVGSAFQQRIRNFGDDVLWLLAACIKRPGGVGRAHCVQTWLACWYVVEQVLRPCTPVERRSIFPPCENTVEPGSLFLVYMQICFGQCNYLW